MRVSQEEPGEGASVTFLHLDEESLGFSVVRRPDVSGSGDTNIVTSDTLVKVGVDPSLRPVLLIKLNSPMLEVKLLVTPHTGVEV